MLVFVIGMSATGVFFTAASAEWRLCFRFRLSVCLFVCMPLNSFSENLLGGFSQNFHQLFLTIKNVTIETIFGIFKG